MRIKELRGKIYMTCTACMSVWADGLSWANANPDRMTLMPNEADHSIVLSCQVTDLAILNDLRTLEQLRECCPDKQYYVSGCLAMRDDIELPNWINRLETPRHDYQVIHDKTLVDFEAPFWLNFKDGGRGDLFRDMYPLRIGRGCSNKCTYCTINKTRGGYAEYSPKMLEGEFRQQEDVLLVADSPSVRQIEDWCDTATRYNKPISIRNVEPSVTVKCQYALERLAENGLLKIYHCPVQSNDKSVLLDMRRNVADTFGSIQVCQNLKSWGTYIATNVITHYKEFDQDLTDIYTVYDYVSWNPYWNGVWDRKEAEKRWDKYLREEKT